MQRGEHGLEDIRWFEPFQFKRFPMAIQFSGNFSFFQIGCKLGLDGDFMLCETGVSC